MSHLAYHPLLRNFPTLRAIGSSVDPPVIQFSRKMPKEDPVDKTIDRLRQIVDVHARSTEMEALIAELEAVGSQDLDALPLDKANAHLAGEEKIPHVELDEEIPGEIHEPEPCFDIRLEEGVEDGGQHVSEENSQADGQIPEGELGNINVEGILNKVPPDETDIISLEAKKEVHSIWSSEYTGHRSKVSFS